MLADVVPPGDGLGLDDFIMATALLVVVVAISLVWLTIRRPR